LSWGEGNDVNPVVAMSCGDGAGRVSVNPLAITTYGYFDNLLNLWRNRWSRACHLSMIMIDYPRGKCKQHGSNKMHKMYYNDGLDVFIHIFGDRSASVKVWSDIVSTYVEQDGRNLAARALKGMRIKNIDIKQDRLATALRPLGR